MHLVEIAPELLELLAQALLGSDLHAFVLETRVINVERRDVAFPNSHIQAVDTAGIDVTFAIACAQNVNSYTHMMPRSGRTDHSGQSAVAHMV